MEEELPVSPRIYSKRFPQFGKPKVIGFIGLENLKFARSVSDKKVNLDLNHNIENVKRKPPDLDVKLTELLRFLLENEVRLKIKGADTFDAAQFYCYRGLMTCVACTPYERREPWKIVAILFKGSIYLCARDTEEKIQKKQQMTEEEKKYSSWGYKFEQYMLSDSPTSEPNTLKPVDETEEFSLIFKTNLNKHTIVYGAEMDGIRCDMTSIEPPNPTAHFYEIVDYLSTKEFVELKTNRHIEFFNQERNFRQHKVKKWWCQSFLVGIDSILCGFRDQNGIVEELKVYEVKGLPKLAKQVETTKKAIDYKLQYMAEGALGEPPKCLAFGAPEEPRNICSSPGIKDYWEPNICFNFLDTFLAFVKRCLKKEIQKQYGDNAMHNLKKVPLTALQFEWGPRLPVHISKHYFYDDDPILPDWFVNSFGKEKDV